MKIGIIAPPWAPIPPDLYGGIEQAVDCECRGLVAAGHQVTLFTTGDSTCPVPSQWVLDHSEGARIGFSVPELRHVLAAYDAMEAAGCDIVHDHTMMGPVLHADGGRPGVPVVTTIHGPLNVELLDIYTRIADRVPLIAISHAQLRDHPELPVEAVIHHGVDVEDFPLGKGDGDYCLYLGRMVAEKGAHRAIVAARKAGMRILLAGKMREPWETSYFEAEIEPLLGDDARYLGEVPLDEKRTLLAGARATLFPIRWNEPFGLVMLESLACGTPVLAFAEGAAPEVVADGRTGYLCRDESEMAEALAGIGSIDRAECRADVEVRFSTERMAREHAELFRRVVDKRPAT
ncbi:MAG: glycosyltransferase family 4 protein [Actinomycetota bacterium]|nr:glycosyltransferase family 4 protein [Actinomycetota bacterium]